VAVARADGTPYGNDFCFVFELGDGLVHRVREYVDTARAARQLGTASRAGAGSGP